MEKKELKMYEVPAVEVTEMELQSLICSSVKDEWSPGDSEQGGY